jgi:hypothetical protein
MQEAPQLHCGSVGPCRAFPSIARRIQGTQSAVASQTTAFPGGRRYAYRLASTGLDHPDLGNPSGRFFPVLCETWATPIALTIVRPLPS